MREADADSLLLAWDTCTGEGVIALGEGASAIAETRFRTVKGHASWLMPMVDSTLAGPGASPADLGALAVGIGPGGYTGVKVGVATAKAMALALDLPLAGVPTLDLLAAHAPAVDGTLLACMDARQGLVYAALYEVDGGRPRRSTEFLCVTPEDAAAAVARSGVKAFAAIGFVGEELERAARESGLRMTTVEPTPPGFPSGSVLLATARAMFAAGLAGDAFSVVPIYLKKPV